MIRRYILLLVVFGAILGLALWCEGPASSADDKTNPADKKDVAQEKPTGKKAVMKAFMRKKLEASQSILEGLVVEDFDMIALGARQLKTMSAAAEFMVIDDPLYAEYARDFRTSADKLSKAAKGKRLDGSTLAYVDLTMSCVECHKYVRTILIAR